MNDIRHIPVLRMGEPYQSMDSVVITDRVSGEPLASVGQANNGLIRRDLTKIDECYGILNEYSCESLIEISKRAGDYFMNESLPVEEGGALQSPDDYVECLSATSGLPHVLCRRNMAKINEVFTEMDGILNGLTRGLDLSIIDKGIGQQANSPVSFFPQAKSMGVVLPSNSPGVNSIWMPSIALKIPVVLKPGREEPWTPYRIIHAFIAAGCPKEAFGFYPTTHEGANTIMMGNDRSIIFGDETTVARYASNPNIQVHGPGWSKVIIGDDAVESWQDYIDLMVDSVVQNGGRSCINASTVITPKYGREIADALAKRLADIKPKSLTDPDAQLSAFANTAFAEAIDATVEEDLRIEGATDLTALYRDEPRRVDYEGQTYLLPTVVYCDSFDHPLANREFMFPFVSVSEMPQEEILKNIGLSLVVSSITNDQRWINQLLLSPLIQRLNVGKIPTCKVSWDQPHEGNLFDFLYTRRAVQFMEAI